MNKAGKPPTELIQLIENTLRGRRTRSAGGDRRRETFGERLLTVDFINSTAAGRAPLSVGFHFHLGEQVWNCRI